MTKQRSPNFPQYSLPVAIEKARTVYSVLHTQQADMARVAEALGYNSLHGRSRRAISALRQYGLLSGSGDALRVTNTAVTILERQPTHPDRIIALQKAAFSPNLFNEISQAFGFQMPDSEDLRIFLVNKGFSRSAVNEIIEIYRDTLGLVASEGGEYDKQEGETESVKELMPMPRESLRSPEFRITPPPRFYGGGYVVPTQQEREEEASHELKFKISADSEARISFKGEVTQQAIEKLIKLLEISKDTFPSIEQPSQPTTQAIFDAITEATQAALTHLNWGLPLQHIRRSQSNSKQWTIELEDGGEIIIDVAPTDTVEEIKSTIMAKLVAGEVK